MYEKKWQKEQMDLAVAAIKAGELVAFPTETVYGLGADATSQEAVKKVYLAKGRPSDNPLIVHVGSQEEVTKYVLEISGAAKKLMDAFWPGPLTIILKQRAHLFPSEVNGGGETTAFRMPANEMTRELIKLSQKPLVGPSANLSGRPSPTTADHVLHDIGEKIAGVLDGGQTEVGLESTVIDMTVEPPMILRPGAITKEMLEEVIGKVAFDETLLDVEGIPKAPGMKYKHYAPEVPVQMISFDRQNWQEAIDWAKRENHRIGLLASRDVIKKYADESMATFELTSKHSVSEAMHQLFSGLRYLDEITPKLTVIFAETFPEKGKGLAYMNRLKKASNHHYFF